jgi:hypothetical protein
MGICVAGADMVNVEFGPGAGAASAPHLIFGILSSFLRSSLANHLRSDDLGPIGTI